jgi:protein required for attachment to host cells
MITWIVLADRTRAAIRRQRKLGGPFELVQELEHAASRLMDRELGTDRPGRTIDGSGTRRHALEAHESPHEHEAKVFAREIAAQLAAARTSRRYDALVLVAEPRFLGMLRDALDHATRQRVRAEIPKRLLDATDADLAQHVADAPSVASR